MAAMRSLMVHTDGLSQNRTRLEVAAHLARRFGARLTAVFAGSPPVPDLPFGYAASSSTVVLPDTVQQQWRDRARGLLDELAADCDTRWAEPVGLTALDALVRQALYADLLVLGQDEPDKGQMRRVPPRFAESTVIDSGRPALVVPWAGQFSHVGTRVLVAWKPTSEAARALSAALPLMEGAQDVRVASWGHMPPSGQGEYLDIEGYLQLHGHQPRMLREDREPDAVGEMLLSRAADMGADLLVMGCYGHSRAREWVLGGASRTILNSMTLPVLMCH